MVVYVESNFVLEHALEREELDSCAGITHLASLGRITLVIPAFAFAEPYQALAVRSKLRARLRDELRTQVVEMARSKPHRDVPANFAALEASLIQSAQFEQDGFRQSSAELLHTAEVIPLDKAVLIAASAIQLELSLSGPDSIMLASVLTHLDNNKPTESCFLNRNARDFDDPVILEKLDRFNCRFFPRFTSAFEYISRRVSHPASPATPNAQ